MIKIIFIACILNIFATFTVNACSAIQEKGQKNITVLMINGIGNEYQDACSSLVSLKNTLSENGIDVDKNTGFGFDLFHNLTDGSIGDINELRIQAALSSEAVKMDSSNTAVGYSFALGTIYNNLVYAVLDKTIKNPCLSYIKYNTTSSSYLKMASKGAFTYDEDYCLRVASTAISLANRLSSLASQGNGVVVVAHSQGNFYLEAAYAILRVKNDPNLSKIRGVGVAAISLYPVSNRYITISQDNALFLAQRLNTEMLNDLKYHPAAFTHTACIRAITSCSLTDGENASTLAAITGTHSFSDTQVAYLGLDNNNIALMHEFVEVYLNKNLTDDSPNRITLPIRISNMVKDSIVELSANSPSVASISPTTATAGEVTTFTVAGTNLPTSRQLDITFNGCANIAVTLKSENLHKFTCTPQGAGTITADIRATAGGTVLKSQQVTVTPVATANLLLGATVSDSCFNCTIEYNGDPNNITDGNMESGRNLGMQSGTFHIFLTNPKSIGRLKLLPAMTPNGLVYYEIQTSTDPTGAVGTWTSHGGEKSSEWANNTWFDFTLNTNTQNVRVIKVNVTYTPSWLAFFEIEAYAP